MTQKVIRKARGVPARLASQVLRLPPVRERLSRRYEASKLQFRDKLPSLAAHDQGIVEALRRSGVYQTTLEALGIEGSQAMFAAASFYAAKYRQRSLAGGLDNNDAFQAGADDLMARREIFDWGLDGRLLDIGEAYLGLPLAYDGLNFFYTKADGRQVAARKWHRDIEDRRVLKIAVYLNDVDENGGPLQILNLQVPGTDSESAPNYPVFTQERLQAKLGRALNDADVATCVGSAGTVIFVDTALKYHRGKPAVARDRCAIFYNYFSRKPLRPFFCERGTLSRKQLAALSTTLSERQRACVQWRDALSLLGRLIPPAPI
jgi:hypothetical protein